MDVDAIPEDDGLLFGCVLDGKGSARLVGWNGVDGWKAGDGPLWVHLDRASGHAETWLREVAGLTPTTIKGLLAEETRPRVFRGKLGTVSILRGVNTNPEADPEDMVAIRMWSDGERVITIRQRKLMTPRDVLRQLVEIEDGPRTAPQLYERLISRLTERMAGTVASFEEALDTMEGDVETRPASEMRRSLSDLRQNTVLLRRYMAPQREALNSLVVEPPKWLDENSRTALRETADRLLRYIEELDAARERAIVIKDDITNRVAESTNQTLYLLAIVSAIFLPLGFLTGLLGINVGGMPGVENGGAFWIACGLMLLVLGVEVAVMRRLKWF